MTEGSIHINNSACESKDDSRTLALETENANLKREIQKLKRALARIRGIANEAATTEN